MKVYALAFLLIAGPATVFSDDLEDALKHLKEVEAKNDPALVKKLAVETCALARQVASAPAPETEIAKDAWSKRAAYAREVEVYTEYSLYATALKGGTDTTIELIETLEQQNPRSKYLDQAYGAYFVALTKKGAASKVPAVAERALKSFPNNEDALLILADTTMNRGDTTRALAYAERLVTTLSKHPAPEGMPAVEWERKRSSAMGRARWIAGIIHSQKGQYFEADKDLRVALPLVKGNDAMLASTLFYLGLANYQLAGTLRDRNQMLEAAKFSDEAAKIKGPLAEQAWRNAQAMRAEALKQR
jgi:tetratricopeptide (TPR) repeat protein